MGETLNPAAREAGQQLYQVGANSDYTLSIDIEGMKVVLKAAGYVVLKERSYRQAQERQRVAEFRARNADEQRKSTERWAQTTLHNEIRELQARCTYLYGAARAHGATAEELAAGSWPTVGINCPHGHVCEGRPDEVHRSQ